MAQTKTESKMRVKNALKVYYDPKGKTLSVWFDDPDQEYVSEEAGDGVILNKNREGQVIGFERLNISFPNLAESKTLPVEIVLSEA